MHEKYKKRCLYKTMSFLIDLKIPCRPIELDAKDIVIGTLFYKREYAEVQNTVCEYSCTCCTSYNRFVSIYSQIIQNKLLNLDDIIIINSNDPFLEYLKQIQEKKPHYLDLAEVLRKEPYFFEALEAMILSFTKENAYTIELALERTEDYILKCIYFMLLYIYKFYKCENFNQYFDSLLVYFDIGNICQLESEKENDSNLIFTTNKKAIQTLIPQSENNNYILALCAAVYYIKKDNEKAYKVFGRIKNKTHHFIDLYSNLLYVMNETAELAALALHMSKTHLYKPETYTVLGNYYSLLKDSNTAIKYFNRAIQFDNRFCTNYTLIAYEYIALENNNEAINNFNLALKKNKNDHRALFGLAELYKNIQMYSLSMFLYKKSAEIHSENGYCWLNFGIVLIRLEKYEDAVYALQRAITLGEEDALLKLGDCYKKMKMYEDAVLMYEKYVEKQKDQRIIKFLQEYHKNKKNIKKAEYYMNM